MAWRRFNGERIEEDILVAVRHTVEKEIANGYRLKVCIGTDSMVRGTVVEYATVIVFLREKKGGFMFIYNERSERSEEHTSELQSRLHLVCRLLLEKKKHDQKYN